ncbi:hypothetical protein SH2C18_21820 [Clostridium sediminicola]|uniref:tetratricopeptide repeat protein n=1 Tax=Clostridium sediminicola TaxID=3114879 RepID=UPI0031F23AFA
MKILNKEVNKKIAIIASLSIVVVILLGFYVKRVITKKAEENNKLLIQQSEVKLSEGKTFFHNGDFEKAIEKYNEIDTTKLYDENRIEALKNIYLSEAYNFNGDIDGAKEYIKKTKDTKNTDDKVLYSIVTNEYLIGEIDSALSDGEKYFEINKENKDLIKTLLAVYLTKGENEKAQLMISTYPVDTLSAYDLSEYAMMYMIVGNREKGFELLKKAWDLNHDEFKIYDVLAHTSVYNKKANIEYINNLLNESPDEVAYKMWLAKIYSDDAKTARGSINLLKQLEEKDIISLETKLIKAMALNNLGESAKATETINEALASSNDDYRVYHTAAWLSINQGDIENAKSYAQKSIEKNQSYTDNYSFLMPEILIRSGEGEKINSYIWVGRFAEPYNYYIIDNLANIYLQRADGLDKAQELYLEAKTLNSNEPEIQYNLAIIDVNKGEIDKGIEILRKCIELNPNEGKYHRTLGSLLLTQGNGEEGISELRDAYKLDENDILTLNNAGSYYISFTDDIHRGYYNLQKAFAGLDEFTDDYYKKIVTENFEKAKLIIESIENGRPNDKVTVPEFVLLF